MRARFEKCLSRGAFGVFLRMHTMQARVGWGEVLSQTQTLSLQHAAQESVFRQVNWPY